MPHGWPNIKVDSRYTTKPSSWLLLRDALVLAVFVAVGVGILSTSVLDVYQVGDYPTGTVGLLMIAVGIGWFGRGWAKRRYTEYGVSDDRVWKKRGIRGSNVQPVLLDDIVDVQIQRRKLDERMGKGDVIIITSEDRRRALCLAHTPNPDRVAYQILRSKCCEIE